MLQKIVALLFSVSLCLLYGFQNKSNKFVIEPIYPKHWPKPIYDFNNKYINEASIELGRKLFYDPILSLDSTISCSNCHLSYTAFTHIDHPISHGIDDNLGTRNSPVLINLAWNSHFMWDGAINHIELQALGPITHPAEMGEELNHVIFKLQRGTIYPKLFQSAFQDSVITGANLLRALAHFQVTLISCNSKYDQITKKNKQTQFSAQEQNGYSLFLKHCNACHTEPLFTNGKFANNGLPIDPLYQDLGRMIITQNKKDSLKFKIPTLRNIEFSPPYMHDGRFKTLGEVLNHYTNGIHKSPSLDPKLENSISLTNTEKKDLIAFLLTLTDKEFLFNKSFGYPRN
jgi:cytochrome c peroxidase